MHHWSWPDVLSAAVLQKEHRGVSDPDQAWILGELIRYLEHPKSGALEFDDMGQHWVAVREAVNAGTLRATDRHVDEVTARFDALIRYASLHLGRRLGADVVMHLNRKERADPDLRAQALRGPGAAELLGRVREDPNLLVLDPSKELRLFRVALTVPLGSKRGRGRGAFIDSVLGGLNEFYEEVVQHLKAWAAAPPKLRQDPEPATPERSSLSSTALSSQDGVTQAGSAEVATGAGDDD